jgi:hypothetical protein
MAEVTTQQVWDEIDKQIFAVLGMVTAGGEARTTGIVYIARDRKLYISSLRSAWKVRHIQQNPHVSMTVTIPKRIPLMPWIQVPPATITFSGVARTLELSDVPADIIKALFRGLKTPPETSGPHAVIEVTPQKEFVTYGVGVSLMGMRDTENARGRTNV